MRQTRGEGRTIVKGEFLERNKNVDGKKASEKFSDQQQGHVRLFIIIIVIVSKARFYLIVPHLLDPSLICFVCEMYLRLSTFGPSLLPWLGSPALAEVTTC